MIETNMIDIIYLCQGNMNMKEHSLKLSQFSKCAPTMVADLGKQSVSLCKVIPIWLSKNVAPLC